MAKKSKFYKSKSLFGLKNKHAVVKEGTIFERDYFTIIPNDGVFDEDKIAFSESNFKFRYRNEPALNRRHFRGNWVKNEDDVWWTLSTMPNSSSTITDESKISLKPNSNSIKEFALYGSAVELIRTTVNDIIMRFPGGIYYPGSGTSISIEDETYYVMLNPYNIDFWTNVTSDMSDFSNKNNITSFRTLSTSYEKYGLSNPPLVNLYDFEYYCPNTIIGEVVIKDITFNIYLDEGRNIQLLSKIPGEKGDILIEPNEQYINEFWETLDDFEKVLLNKDSYPLYKAILDTPEFDGQKFIYNKKKYIWPRISEESIVPDVSSLAFKNYLSSLIDLAQHHDEYDSDVIWRILTHESIKNMDWSHIRNSDGEQIDEDTFDSSRVKTLLQIQGRQFDDLKRYADNIKNSLKISYDGNSNVPDYFLKNNVSLHGWDSVNVIPKSTNTNVTDTIKFEDGNILLKSGFTESYVNSAFYQYLLLNSDYIKSMKGTRRGLETILGLLGLKNIEDYEIIEYFKEVRNIDSITKEKLEYYISLYDDYAIEDHINNMAYPIAFIKGDNDTEYIVPWVSEETSDFYFQSKGGWGKSPMKKIDLEIAPNVNEITSDEDFVIYGETVPYIKYVSTITDMINMSETMVYKNMICFVNNISEIYEKYTTFNNEEIEYNKISHYFILENQRYCFHAGYLDNENNKCWGWRNIAKAEYEDQSQLTFAGKLLLYLESMPFKYEGNNPHIGYGQYDNGESFYNKFTQLLKTEIDDGSYDFLLCNKPELYEEVKKFGFTLIDKKSNDYLGKIKALFVADEDNIGYTMDPATLKIDAILSEYATLNSKRLKIKFNDATNGRFSDEYKEYINNVVLKYLEPMIPSTAILEYEFW